MKTSKMRGLSGKWTAAVALSAMLLEAQGARAQAQSSPPAQDAAKPAAAAPPQAVPTDEVIRTESKLVLVDTVVTDKKGHYVTDLTRGDFKVFEDNKEQTVTSFSSESDPARQTAGQKHYMILFFDTTTMETGDQAQARNTAAKFVESNAGPDQLMAIVNFTGSLVIQQNFTSNTKLLQAAVSGTKTPNIDSTGQSSPAMQVAMNGQPTLSNAEADFGVRTMLLAIRSLAKNLRGVPGRKMLILFTAGFPLNTENMTELTATIDACNKANVAIYPLDVRGLTPPSVKLTTPLQKGNTSAARTGMSRLVLAGYSPALMPDPQHAGGGGTGGGTGGGGGHGGGGTGTGGTGGTGGGTGSGGGKGGTGTGTGGGGKAGGTSGTPGAVGSPYSNYYNNPMNQPQVLLPKIPNMASTNQQVMQMLAEGTGGFAIYNTNDLLGGLQRIAAEMNQFYVLGYVPHDTEEGSCHTLRVKLNKGGMEVRSRSGYCNVRATNPLEGKPVEKQMEAQASGATTGTIHASMEAPYFYAAPNVARVNLTMEIPGDALVFNKDKGKYRANVNILGIAYKSDGSVGARFSDTLSMDMEKDEWKEFTKAPYRYQNQFDAAPGTYKLAVVLSSGGEGFAKMEKPLQIDAYDGNKFTLGGVVLSSSMQRVDEIPTEVDATLLEDRKPLIVKGMQITPAASYQFKKTDTITLYSELYEPLLKTEPTTKVAAGYRIFDSANKEVLFTGGIPLDAFVEKGNPVVPFALRVDSSKLPAGSYRLVLLAVDGKNNQAPQRPVEFSVSN
ncbi:MAG: VWA domain-containing protein [Candidatus Acidiferrum sp.]